MEEKVKKLGVALLLKTNSNFKQVLYIRVLCVHLEGSGQLGKAKLRKE